MNRGTVYDGPLLLLVNGQSASASEVLAAALQDYNRAIIAGQQTFGKATAQIIIPVDTSLNKSFFTVASMNANPEFGFIKITMKKLYRVSGKTAQLKGVQPDILLPDIYERLQYRETTIPFALPSDTVNKKLSFKQLPAFPVQSLSANSKNRIENNAQFASIKKMSEWVERSHERRSKPLSLKWEDAEKKIKENVAEWESIKESSEKPSTAYQVENHSLDKDRMKIDAYRREINDNWLKNISNDAYIDEAYHIMTDYIKLLTNKS
jgi:carboxyl-terminal processing protease